MGKVLRRDKYSIIGCRGPIDLIVSDSFDKIERLGFHPVGSERRKEQVETLLHDIGEDQPHIIVAGDFNTFTANSLIELEQQFAQFGLERVSRGAGHTFERGNFGFSLDHIFARGASADVTGVRRYTNASDHCPLWVKLSLNE